MTRISHHFNELDLSGPSQEVLVLQLDSHRHLESVPGPGEYLNEKEPFFGPQSAKSAKT